jgi:hypothetical protein
MTQPDEQLKQWLRTLIEEEFGPKPIEIAPRWQGGTLILKPDNDTQAKDIPIEVFFKKIIGIRESLRVLEQKINAHPQLSQEDKLTFQSYITKSYGSLTTFNILFKEGKDRFVGSGGGGGDDSGSSGKAQLSMKEAKAKLGLNEYGK